MKISHKQAAELIVQKQVYVNGIIAIQKQNITLNDEITVNGEIINPKKDIFYFAWYKPIGVESTLNIEIENNLKMAVGIKGHFFPLGRLDKQSEGLMILTNDGSIFPNKEMIFSTIVKVYSVKTNKPITNDFIEKMQNGVVIMGRKTNVAKLEKLNDCEFKIELKQGLNRQIRRMCYKLGYEVLQLKRIQFGKFKIDKMKNGDLRRIEKVDFL